MSEITRGEYIKIKRIEKSWSQDQLAEIIGVTRETISSWENNRREIKPEHRKKLAEAFGVSELAIYYGKDDAGLDDTTKEWLSREIEALDAIEDRGILAFDMAAAAFGTALIAVGFAFLAAFNRTALSSVLCLVLIIFGAFFIAKGRQVVKKFERKKAERRAARTTDQKTEQQ